MEFNLHGFVFKMFWFYYYLSKIEKNQITYVYHLQSYFTEKLWLLHESYKPFKVALKPYYGS